MNIEAVETWLREHSGLDASTLGAGVVARAARDRIEARRCARVEDYLALLATSEEERHTLIERVVVPETWFFRDRPALDALAQHVTSDWAAGHPGGTFQVLSVPCSTGEEPYSIAIALAQAGWPLAQLRIEAIDISRGNLARARAGVYGRNSFRGENLAFRDALFETHGRSEWRVHDTVRAPVRFEHANLLANDFALGRGPYDAIFCRNLLIYFDRETQARAIRVLERLLAPGAWFAVGPAEAVLLLDHGFTALPVRSGFLLHKPPVMPRPAARKPLPPKTKVAAATVTAPARQMPFGKTAAPPRPPAAASVPSAIPAKPAADTVSAIRALADAGQLREAARRGEALLEQAGASPELLYLLAVVAEANGDTVQAETYFRQTLYLAPNHGEAVAHLALLLERKGDARGARQLRRRAQRLADEEVA